MAIVMVHFGKLTIFMLHILVPYNIQKICFLESNDTNKRNNYLTLVSLTPCYGPFGTTLLRWRIDTLQRGPAMQKSFQCYDVIMHVLIS